MSKERVSLADAIKGAVSDLDTAQREQIEYIEEPRISGDDDNFYSIDGIEELAANIELVGLQQPLRVRPDPDAEGGYIVVSGHRRLTAIRTICKHDEPEKWKTVPCIVERGELSPAMRELRLIMANSDTRKMNSADTAQQVERVRELLYQLQEEGVEFPGRMRDHVAEACKISKTKIATLDVISKGLSKSNAIQSAWKKGTLSEAAAYELARLPRELQDEIAEVYESKHKDYDKGLQYLYVADVKKIGEEIQKLEALKCDVSGVACQSCAEMKRRHLIAAYIDYSYGYCSCAEKCCEDCTNLKSCKDVCPQLLATQKKMKADAAFAAKLEKAKRAEEDAPKIALLRKMWEHFGQARNAAGVSVEDVFDMDNEYCEEDSIREHIKCERLEVEFDKDDELPPVLSCMWLEQVQALVDLADKFGVSLDYLFCRTDEPKMASGAAAAVSESDTKPTWRTGTPSDGARFDAVIEIDFEDGNAPARAFAQWFFDHWDAGYGKVTDKVPRWYPLPEDDK